MSLSRATAVLQAGGQFEASRLAGLAKAVDRVLSSIDDPGQIATDAC